MERSVILAAVVVLGLLALGWYIISGKESKNTTIETTSEAKIKYIAIGDSYTIGNGVPESGRWPNVLVKNLRENGVDIELISNPAVSGYRVRDAIETELPIVQRLRPDFVTVLIGANDNFGQIPVNIYRQELIELLDKLQSMLTNPKNIVLITIPDYSKSPAAAGYKTSGASESIEEYNKVVKDEAEKRDLKVADIFPVSQTMTGREDYISDGLHPSAEGYAKWEKVIYPVVRDFLNTEAE